MGDESLFYRPKNPLSSTVGAFSGGPSPSRRDDPAVRFDPNGVAYHESYGHGPITRLGWKEVRAVAVLPGPIEGRQALCVYPFHELPEPDVPVSDLWTGSGPGLGIHFAAHNWHIHTAAQRGDDGGDLHPAGYHLRAALGGDYLAVALTAGRGTTGVAFEVENPETPSFTEAELPPAEPDTIESAFADDATRYLADLRGVAASAVDAAGHPRMRMADYFLDQPALTGFDAIAHVTETRASDYARRFRHCQLDAAG